MPELLLPVRHFRQNSEASCLAACARTVMAYTGDVRSEELLVELFDIDMAFGAPASRLLRLSRWGYQVDYDSFSLPLLRASLVRNVPPIVLIKTGFLTYWAENVAHACVLVGLDETTAYLNDPWLSTGP
ncbi:MAG: hypothetical protein KDI07_02455 [Anaerolineae bacterium]|nr:hypothetical protein [Anaerolineae bacterium]